MAAGTKNVLELDGRQFLTERPPAQPRSHWSRRTWWVVVIGAGALFAAALGYLIAGQVQARGEYGQAHTSLGLTQLRTRTVAEQLHEVSGDLRVLETQVGSDTTALNQDSSQL